MMKEQGIEPNEAQYFIMMKVLCKYPRSFAVSIYRLAVQVNLVP